MKNEYIDITPLLIKSMASYPRTIGRYNSSEIYAILNGWTTPEQWLKPPEKTPKEMKVMWKGTWGHKQVQSLLKQELCEQKNVVEYKDIKIVGKADYMPDGEYSDEVWEFKTSETIMEKAKDWQKFQVKLYTTMFKRPKGVIIQPVETESQILLKRLGTVNRDDEWFAKQLEKVYEFHLEIKKLIENRK